MASTLANTYHAPVGTWSSLTFGAPNCGVCIQHESPAPVENAGLLIAVSRGRGRTACMPFARALPAGWKPAEVSRTLTACTDTFAATLEGAAVSFRVYTPHAAIPNPKRARSLQYSVAPGLLIEMTVDNSASDEPATAFLGLHWLGEGPLRPLDWSARALCGVAVGNKFALGALPVKGEVYSVTGADLATALESGAPSTNTDADQGGVGFKVQPRATRTVVFTLAFHHSGLATYGIDGRYVFGGYFPRIEAGASFVLSAAPRIRESALTFDARLAASCASAERAALFAHAISQYDACTQLVDTGAAERGAPPAVHYTVLSGARARRNAIDAAVDHLPWELFRNPWTVRNIFDLYTASYAYADQVTFPADAGVVMTDGGMALCRDMGAGQCYSPATTSASERTNTRGGTGYMTSESVLSGIYLLTSYALIADDNPWSKTRLPFARELLSSMENRDHADPAQRNGVLKAESILAGPKGAEITTFADVDELLGRANGSTYLAVKTFCACILLTTYFQNNNDLHSADYAYAMAQKTATTLGATFDEGRGLFPANMASPGENSAAPVILEPLAVPTFLGLTSTLAEYFPTLVERLKRHALSCLKPGVCVDGGGGLKLASHTDARMPGKLAASLYVMESLLGIDVATEAPKAIGSLLAQAIASPTADSRLAAAMYLVKPTLIEPEAADVSRDGPQEVRQDARADVGTGASPDHP